MPVTAQRQLERGMPMCGYPLARKKELLFYVAA